MSPLQLSCFPPAFSTHRASKANVLFFDNKSAQEAAWTKNLWVYDLDTNMHFTQKTNPLRRADLDDFVKCFKPENRHTRKPTWSEKNPDGRLALVRLRGTGQA